MPIYIVQAKKTALKANLSPSALTMTLRELVDTQGNPIAMASFGDWGTVVVKQNEDLIEICKFTNIVQNANGSATLTLDASGRNILPITPYTGYATGENFLAGSDVIVTNDPLTVMSFGNVNNINTWALTQTFSAVPQTTGGNAVTANGLVRKAQLDSAILGIVTAISLIVDGTAGETVSAGNLLYLDIATNRWWKADADTPATVNNTILAIAQGSGTAGNLISGGLMLRGVDTNQSGLTAGAVYYASNTAGGISITAGTTEVSVGIAKSTTELYFDPRFNQQLTEDQQDALDQSESPSASNAFITQSRFQKNAEKYVADGSGSSTAYTATFSPALTAYTTGQVFYVKIGLANTTTTPTLNANGLGAKTIVKGVSTALSVGDILAGQLCAFGYDGTNLVLLNPVSTNASPPTYKNFLASRDISIASGVQNIPHGLSAVPKSVSCVYYNPIISGGSRSTTGWSNYDGTTTSSFFVVEDGAGVQDPTYTGTSASNFITAYLVAGTGTHYTGVITWDATNIIITWTKSGSPTGSITMNFNCNS